MPTLDNYSLPQFAGEIAEEDILNALRTVQDQNGQLLCMSVERGFDAEILSVIAANPQPQDMPLVRLNVWSDQEELAMNSTAVLSHYTASLYFMYYYGVPSLDTSFSSFVNLRRRHLRACLDALQWRVANLTQGIDPLQSKYWKRDSGRPVLLDFTTPFRYLNRSVELKQGFNCVRVDYPLLVNTQSVGAQA